MTTGTCAGAVGFLSKGAGYCSTIRGAPYILEEPINVGDIGPTSRYEVRERYEPGPNILSKIKFESRIPMWCKFDE
jgi:hypothetical protein